MTVQVTDLLLPDAARLQQDLAWSLHSPPLWLGEPGDAVWPEDSWFRALDIPPEVTLQAPPHAHHFRLGLHFERLVHAWLRDVPGFELLAANLQVQDGKRTVGEFDLLVEYRGQIEHWELAVKFYIGMDECSHPGLFYGPNTSDRLDIKLSRLANHQLKLATHPAAIPFLLDRGLTPAVVRCLVKGRLFYPWQLYQAFLPAQAGQAPHLNPGHLRGWWLGTDDLDKLGDLRVAWLPKAWWLAGFDRVPCPLPVMDRETLEHWLEEPGREPASQVVVLTSQGLELSRGFILKPAWFEHQRASSSRLTS